MGALEMRAGMFAKFQPIPSKEWTVSVAFAGFMYFDLGRV